MKVRQFYRTPLRVALLLSYTLTANLPPLCRAGAGAHAHAKEPYVL